MTKKPDQLDLFSAPARGYELAEPALLRSSRRPQRKDKHDKALAASIRRHGVMTPLLVMEEEDGQRAILSGVRRAAVAADEGQLVPVHVLSRPKVDALCAAFAADEHVQSLSTIEKGWRFAPVLAAAEEAGIRVTVDWVMDEIGVSRGKAHGLLSVARYLSQERVEDLAAKAGLDSARVLSLPFHPAVHFARATTDEDAVRLLKQRFGSGTSAVGRGASWWMKIVAWLARTMRQLLAVVSGARPT